jgi:hypothetical protein
MIKALAYSELTRVVTKNHVEIAFDFLSYKLEFRKNFVTIEIPTNFNIKKC